MTAKKKSAPAKRKATSQVRGSAVNASSDASDDAGCGSDHGMQSELVSDPSLNVSEPVNAGSGVSTGLEDAVKVEVRAHEVVITIRLSALQSGGMQSDSTGAIDAVTALTQSVTRGIPAAAPQSDSTRVGLTQVPADKMGDGYSTAWIRTDLRDEYMSAFQTVKALGGVMTSSGAIRDLGSGATAGRSATSFHYTGRAFDLWINTGMQGDNDRYLVQRAGGTPANPESELLCISVNPQPDDPNYDASMIRTGEVEYLVWKKGTGAIAKKRQATYFSLTAVLKKFGWVNIPSRTDWVTQYLSAEWWHFQHHKGLVDGVSLFGDELRAVWPGDKVANSGLALNAVFKGRSFRV